MEAHLRGQPGRGQMSEIKTFEALERLGRVQLSKHFFMRDFLYSEIANFHGIPNLPSDPDLAIAAGERLCQHLLDPLFETFGNIAIQSSYGGSAVNGFGNEKGMNCARNEGNYAGHTWDRRDAQGRMGAGACIMIPWFAGQYEQGRDWRDLAWWIHDHLPYSSMYFFPRRAAFNLTWREQPSRAIGSYIPPKGHLLPAGAEPVEPEAARRERYADFPGLREMRHPVVPAAWSKATERRAVER